MTEAVAKERVTLAEYLRQEEKATDRHEFHDGEVLAMSGGTFRHSLVSSNVNYLLKAALRGSPCRALDSNMRVATKLTRRYVYPDASVVCGQPEFDVDDPNQTTLINPKVVIEVLSDSTEAYDRGEKFEHYRHIPSLREYVLVSQHRPLVETFLRQEDGTWSLATHEGIETSATLRSLEIQLPLAEVYAGVEFPERKASPPSA